MKATRRGGATGTAIVRNTVDTVKLERVPRPVGRRPKACRVQRDDRPQVGRRRPAHVRFPPPGREVRPTCSAHTSAPALASPRSARGKDSDRTLSCFPRSWHQAHCLRRLPHLSCAERRRDCRLGRRQVRDNAGPCRRQPRTRPVRRVAAPPLHALARTRCDAGAGAALPRRKPALTMHASRRACHPRRPGAGRYPAPSSRRRPRVRFVRQPAFMVSVGRGRCAAGGDGEPVRDLSRNRKVGQAHGSSHVDTVLTIH